MAIVIFLGAGLFAVKSCKRDKDDANVTAAVRELIESVAEFEVKTPFSEIAEIVPESERSWIIESNDPDDHPGIKKSSSELDCYAFNTNWNCATIKYSALQNPEDFVMFNPLASVLWPGNLVQGESLESGVPTGIPVTEFRQPGNISLAIVSSAGGGANKMSRTVDRMQYSSVNQAMNDILSGFTGDGYAQYSFTMNVVRTTESLDFALNASFSGYGASAKANLNIKNSDSMTYILVKLRQAYYTMVYDDPRGLDGVFTSNISVTQELTVAQAA